MFTNRGLEHASPEALEATWLSVELFMTGDVIRRLLFFCTCMGSLAQCIWMETSFMSKARMPPSEAHIPE